ncbi:hypothetical protein PRZ48_006995 [Zasmidium cellare]|uniref:N-acetyltransferase domain-containing protein n=1 Tax=Zasmidium cellare TaxID=395010 RepID=A0ABR0EK59_ZASCE|nr:hypothetical protein PRZ48_006995 [Zasmidium cellare]
MGLDRILTSDRLIYRAIESTDTDILIKLHQDTEAHTNFTPFLPTPQGRAIAETDLASFESCMLAAMICIKPPNRTCLGDFTPEGPGIPIGTITLKDANANIPNGRYLRNAKLGINILPKYHCKGYGTEAVKWCLQWGFKQAGLNKIGANVYEHNVRSAALFESLRFTLDGKLRDEVWFDGSFWDEWAYSMLEVEWKEMYCGPSPEISSDGGSL